MTVIGVAIGTFGVVHLVQHGSWIWVLMPPFAIYFVVAASQIISERCTMAIERVMQQIDDEDAL